jgi:hypothetical protein
MQTMTNLLESIEGHAGQPIKCAPLSGPTVAQRQITALVQCLVVAVAIVAVLLLMASAFYYTGAKTMAARHVHLLAPHIPLLRLG